MSKLTLSLALAGKTYQVQSQLAQSIAIPLEFDGAQPNHFGADKATAVPLRGGDFVGDTRQGGSCNVAQITFVPHCNGTHTETVGHIVDEDVFLHEALEQVLIPATLVTVTPRRASDVTDAYIPNREASDLMIDCASLKAALVDVPDECMQALVIRTLPNSADKQAYSYGGEHFPPFISRDAMALIVEKGVQHLLVDIPSVDKMYDEGHLDCHHLFWNVPATRHALEPTSKINKTITEMIYVPNYLDDGLYLLDLQVPAFLSDAAPSRPMLIPLLAQD